MKSFRKVLVALLLLPVASACAPSPEALSRYEPPPRVEVTFFFATFDAVTKEQLTLPVTVLVVTPGYEREVLHVEAPHQLTYNNSDRRGVEDYTSVTASMDAAPVTAVLACWWVATSGAVQYTSENTPEGQSAMTGDVPATCTFDGLVNAKLREARQGDLDVLDGDGGSAGS